MICLRRTSPTGKERSLDTFLAGLIGGYTVFGRGIQSRVKQQITIYVFARVVLALAKPTVQFGYPSDKSPCMVSKGNSRAEIVPIFAGNK